MPNLEQRTAADSIGTDTYQIFRVGEETVIHEYLPPFRFFPVTRDGVWQAIDAEVGIDGKALYCMEILGARVRSKSKERANLPSGDQILYHWLSPHQLVVGVADGVAPPPRS